MASQTRSGGTFSGWTNSSNAGASDNAYAYSGSIADAAYSPYLVATNFGFSLLPSARILGIETMMEVKSGAFLCNISRVVLRLSAADVGTAKKPATDLATTDANYVYGGAADKWGAIWTPANVNDATFGIRWRGYNPNPPLGVAEFYCDYISMTVYYEVKSFRALLGVGA